MKKKKQIIIKEKHLCDTCAVKCGENLEKDTVTYRCDYYEEEKKK